MKMLEIGRTDQTYSNEAGVVNSVQSGFSSHTNLFFLFLDQTENFGGYFGRFIGGTNIQQLNGEFIDQTENLGGSFGISIWRP